MVNMIFKGAMVFASHATNVKLLHAQYLLGAFTWEGSIIARDAALGDMFSEHHPAELARWIGLVSLHRSFLRYTHGLVTS